MLRRLIDSPTTYFVGAGILLLIAISTQFELSVPSRPAGTVEDIAQLRNRGDLNVVFIVVDTLRADRMGMYGYERPTTPVLDDLAAHGIVFENVIAQSAWTKTSMASIWTATYPARNGILRYNHVVPEEAVMPAEVFKQAGYRTAGIWRNGWTAPNFGFSQGFDLYHQPKPGADAKLQRHSPSPRPIEGTDEDLAISARDFLDNFGQQKFFLYLHMMDLHQYIFDEYAEDFGPRYTDAYDKSITWVDRLLGSIVQAIDDAGVLQRTLIVIASDHGEAFQEHGFEGHARNLYREVVDVPWIIIPPVILERGIRVETLVGNLDIWPTVLDLIGLPPLGESDGVSMLPLILQAGGASSPGPVEGLERPIVAHMDKRWGTRNVDPEEVISLMTAQSKVFVHPYDPKLDEFYDRVIDPNEENDLYAKSPPELAVLLEQVDAYRKDDEAPWGAQPGEIELDAMRLNQLKALGYHIGD